jgi:hypothetical protein
MTVFVGHPPYLVEALDAVASLIFLIDEPDARLRDRRD